MAAGWFRKLTVAGPAVFKGTVTTPTVISTTGSLSLKTLAASSGVTGTKGLFEAVETKNTTGSLTAYGLSILTMSGATADKVFTLPVPTAAGVMKQIVANATGVQKLSVTVGGATTAGFIVGGGGNAAGSTYRTLVFSSKSTQQRMVSLVGVSTAAWALVSKSTGVTLAG